MLTLPQHPEAPVKVLGPLNWGSTPIPVIQKICSYQWMNPGGKICINVIILSQKLKQLGNEPNGEVNH